MADDQLRIRLLAYRIWEAEDCPDGQAERHWHMACRMVAAERITDVPQDAQPRPAVRSTKASEPVAVATTQAASDSTDKAPAKKAPAKRASTAKRRSTASSEEKATASKTAAGKTATGARKTTATKKKAAASEETPARRKRSDSSNDDNSSQ